MGNPSPKGVSVPARFNADYTRANRACYLNRPITRAVVSNKYFTRDPGAIEKS
jgi:hypothetical protein